MGSHWTEYCGDPRDGTDEDPALQDFMPYLVR